VPSPAPMNVSALAALVSPHPGGAVPLLDDAGSVISPVFTLWITLMALYISACCARCAHCTP
jgi:hypothetical protein